MVEKHLSVGNIGPRLSQPCFFVTVFALYRVVCELHAYDTIKNKGGEKGKDVTREWEGRRTRKENERKKKEVTVREWGLCEWGVFEEKWMLKITKKAIPYCSAMCFIVLDMCIIR